MEDLYAEMGKVCITHLVWEELQQTALRDVKKEKAMGCQRRKKKSAQVGATRGRLVWLPQHFSTQCFSSRRMDGVSLCELAWAGVRVPAPKLAREVVR